ncbi:Inner membrane protein YbbJ [Hartmannibacter diazotrophicus]|uniref:Inner membrane protein YbbJ n=1 Tax=Hartmannibacter diazotrophicus TaxID=1482074 RepID=A0A2C9DBS8_9HYPH|nr:NfeD family protein [Hartmannibacter diazotrophicus]SON57629.1 Inner membrane protein YbbJ [Hartmannibacter diazotrophicus]
MILDLVGELGAWSWMIAAILLAVVELAAPGTFFIWFAVAAVVVGLVAFVIPIGWQVQCLLFLALAVVAALLGRKVYGQGRKAVEDPYLNDRAGRQVGRKGTLDEPIVNGMGRVRLDDSVWRVEGPDLPAGTRVKVLTIRSGHLVVEPDTTDPSV